MKTKTYPEIKIEGQRVYLPSWVSEIVDRSEATIRGYMSTTQSSWFTLNEDEGDIIRLQMYNSGFPFITEQGLTKIKDYHEHGRPDNGNN